MTVSTLVSLYQSRTRSNSNHLQTTMMICWSSYDNVMIFIRWYADRHMTMWQSLWDDCHMRRWQCVYEANTSLSLVILQTTMHSPLPLETFCLTGPTITKVCNRVPLGGFKWPWDLVIWWLCWSQSVETPLVLKYIPTRPSLCRVWIRAVAGLEEQSFVRNCSSVGRAWRGQPCSSRCSNSELRFLCIFKVFGATPACLSTSHRGGCSSWKMASCSKRPSVRSWPTFLRLAPLFVHFKPEKGWFRNPILHASF